MAFLLGCGHDAPTGRRCSETTCGASAAGHGAGEGGFGNVAGASGAAGTVANTSNELTVRVEDIEEMTIEVVTIQCAGACADVIAVAEGGHAPYAFEWEDGSTSAMRRVCPSASTEYVVSATDTPIDTDEFQYEAHTARAQVTATVLDCTSDAGVHASEPEPTCDGDAVAGDVMGASIYFGEGATYPAGRYRIAHLDGCMKYGPPVDWSINNLGVGTWFLIGETSDVQLGVLPGLAGLGVPAFEDCVRGSRNEPPLEIDFAGGMLGVWLFDYPYTDNIEGEAGRNPTWCLTAL